MNEASAVCDGRICGTDELQAYRAKERTIVMDGSDARENHNEYNDGDS